MRTHKTTTSTFGTKAPALKSLGFDPVPVTGKKVLVKRWTTMDITEESVNKQASIGLVLYGFTRSAKFTAPTRTTH
jgi:hypothetical protein